MTDAVTDAVHDLLMGPRVTRYRIQQVRSKYLAIYMAMMPGGIQYDKVQTSPADMMPEKMDGLVELEEKILRLEDLHRRQIEDIETACGKLSDELQRTVLLMFYVGGISVREIAETLHYSERTIFRVRRQGQCALAEIVDSE